MLPGLVQQNMDEAVAASAVPPVPARLGPAVAANASARAASTNTTKSFLFPHIALRMVNATLSTLTVAVDVSVLSRPNLM